MRVLVAVATLALLFAPSPSAAEGEPDYGRPGWYFTLGGVVGPFVSLEDDIEDALAAMGDFANVRVNTGAGVLAAVGYRWGRYVAMELDYDYLINTKISVDGIEAAELDSWSMMINTKIYPWNGRFQPFGAIGIGSSGDRLTDVFGDGMSLKNTEFAAQFGIGLDSYLNEHFVIVLDASYTLTTGDLESYDRFVAGLGLQYRF